MTILGNADGSVPSLGDISYQRLNEVLYCALFSHDLANRPVYLEITDEVAESISKLLSIEKNELQSLICETVSNALVLDAKEPNLFNSMKHSLRNWYLQTKVASENSHDIPIYPHLPLLLVFAMAASDMGTQGGFSTNAYYPRLREILGVKDKRVLEESYRKVAITFWSALNIWLDKYLKGKKGIGTAYSISAHKFIGFALSQALVRSVDRAKLPRLFRENGFAPFTSLVERDMERIIDAWTRRDDSYSSSYKNPSKPFRKLWETNEARARIAHIICHELELWDGSIGHRGVDENQLTKDDFDVRLEMTHTTFLSNAINLTFAFSAPIEGPESEMVGIGSLEQISDIYVSVRGDGSGWRRPNTGASPIAHRDLLEGMLSLNVGKPFRIERFPRKVVAMRLDELNRTYLEVERLELGLRSSILVQNHNDLVASVRNVLFDSARLGWKEFRSDALDGLPENWVLFSGVELIRNPAEELLPKDASLEALKPIFAGTLMFSDGLQLPGRPPKWHSDIRLEIHASVMGAQKIAIQILQETDQETDQGDLLCAEKRFQDSTTIWELEGGTLGDGDYIVRLITDDDEFPTTQKILRLRSGDTIDEASWKSSERLVHDFSSSKSAVVQATPLRDTSSNFVDGANTIVNDSERTFVEEIPSEDEIWWLETPSQNVTARLYEQLKLNSVAVESCFGTSRHVWELPPALPSVSRLGFEKNGSGTIVGVCRYCQLTRKMAASPWRAEKKKARKITGSDTKKATQIMPRVNLKNIISLTPRNISHNTLLDAVMHTGGGSSTGLETIASGIDSGALFKHQFIQDLDQLGFIDIRYDEFNEIQSWEVSPSFLVNTSNGWYLTGFQSAALWKSLVGRLDSSKYQELIDAKSFRKRVIRGLSVTEMEALVKDLDIKLVIGATSRMLSLLPPITQVALDLPTKSVPGFDALSQYEPKSSSWVDTQNFNLPGGYRVRSAFRNKYVIRLEGDVVSRSVRYVSAEFAKHFEAALHGRPLIAYHYASESLVVPIGARLPGLYGRALVLSSGMTPKIDSKGKLLTYTNIKPEAARLITHKLGTKVS